MTTIHPDGTEYIEREDTGFDAGLRESIKREFEWGIAHPRKHLIGRWLVAAFWSLVGYAIGG